MDDDDNTYMVCPESPAQFRLLLGRGGGDDTESPAQITERGVEHRCPGSAIIDVEAWLIEQPWAS